jgi:hypothetical protein
MLCAVNQLQRLIPDEATAFHIQYRATNPEIVFGAGICQIRVDPSLDLEKIANWIDQMLPWVLNR